MLKALRFVTLSFYVLFQGAGFSVKGISVCKSGVIVSGT
jgi:hypothetical protein